MKKFKLIGCFVALFAVMGANVWNAAVVSNSSELSIANVEAMGIGGEPYGEVVTHWFEVDKTTKSNSRKTKTVTEYYCDEATDVSDDHCVPGSTKTVKEVERIYEPYSQGPWPSF